MIAEMSGLMTLLKASKDIAESMVGLRDAEMIRGKVLEFQSKLFEAQQLVFAAQEARAALVERVSKLEEQLTRIKAWDVEKQR